MNEIKNLFYDYYNSKWHDNGIVGTITVCTSHNGSGTFWVIEDDTNRWIAETSSNKN